VIYARLDPATAILEVAVHKGFDVQHSPPHRLLAIDIAAASIDVVQPLDVPSLCWLNLDAVSRHSWNLLISTTTAASLFGLNSDERFALDSRLTSISSRLVEVNSGLPRPDRSLSRRSKKPTALCGQAVPNTHQKLGNSQPSCFWCHNNIRALASMQFGSRLIQPGVAPVTQDTRTPLG
jgi:hypothetical protein